jgi:hypothetical protein
MVEKAACRSRHYTVADVAKALADGTAQLWTAFEGLTIQAVAVTQIVPCSAGKYCSIWITAGDEMQDWLPFISQLEDWARREGCSFMSAEPRPGFARVLKQYGYEMPHVILEKEL